jgi:hypothetical protein
MTVIRKVTENSLASLGRCQIIPSTLNLKILTTSCKRKRIIHATFANLPIYDLIACNCHNLINSHHSALHPTACCYIRQREIINYSICHLHGFWVHRIAPSHGGMHVIHQKLIRSDFIFEIALVFSVFCIFWRIDSYSCTLYMTSVPNMKIRYETKTWASQQVSNCQLVTESLASLQLTLKNMNLIFLAPFSWVHRTTNLQGAKSQSEESVSGTQQEQQIRAVPLSRQHHSKSFWHDFSEPLCALPHSCHCHLTLLLD